MNVKTFNRQPPRVILLAALTAPLGLTTCGKLAASSTLDSTSSAISADTIQEVSDAIADDSSKTASLLQNTYTPDAVTVSRTCSGGGSANTPVTVGMTLTGSTVVSVTRPKISVSAEVAESGTLSRVWTPPSGQTIQCNAANTHVRFNWASDAIVNGLSVVQTVNRTRNVARTITVTATNTSTTMTNNFTVDGTRSVSWATGAGVDNTAETITRTKTIYSTLNRAATIIAKDGSQIDLSLTISTPVASPIVVDVVRSSLSPYALKTKTIKSGTVTATKAGSERIESTFSNVLYDLAATNPCLPTSGTITVESFKPDTATTATSSYTISFGASTDSGVSITPSGGTETDFSDFNPKGCDLEKEI